MRSPFRIIELIDHLTFQIVNLTYDFPYPDSELETLQFFLHINASFGLFYLKATDKQGISAVFIWILLYHVYIWFFSEPASDLMAYFIRGVIAVYAWDYCLPQFPKTNNLLFLFC